MFSLKEIQDLIEIIEKHEENINYKDLYDKLKLNEKGFQLSKELEEIQKTLMKMNKVNVEVEEK